MLLLVNCMHMCWLLCINTEAGVKMLLSAVFFVHKDVVKREARSVFFVHKDVVKREARAVFFVHKDVVKREARAVFFVFSCGDVVEREFFGIFINQNKMHCLHLSGCGVLSVLCVVVLYCVGVQCGGCSCRWGSGIWDLLWIVNDV